MSEVYYKPSGKLSPSFFLFFILFQVLAIPLLSFVYIHLIYYIPVVYFNFFVTVGCGLAVGLVMMGAITLGKVRNNKIALLFGIIAMCVMKYVQWCVYIPIVFTDAYELFELTLPERLGMSLELLINPAFVFEYAGFINQVGVWSIFSIDFTGILLIVVWLLEFLLMTATACIVFLEKSKYPFCEEDDTWYVEMPQKKEACFPENLDNLKADIEKGDFNELIRLTQEYKQGDSQYLSLSFYKAQNLEHYYLKIKQITVTIEKGKEKTQEKDWVEYLAIDHNSVKEIQSLSQTAQADSTSD